eukprot:6313292-Prymnesium_polylepis.1
MGFRRRYSMHDQSYIPANLRTSRTGWASGSGCDILTPSLQLWDTWADPCSYTCNTSSSLWDYAAPKKKH